MKKSVSVITNALFEKLPNDLPFYTQDGLVQYGLPPFLVKRISQTVYLKILEKVSLPDESWLNHESDAVTDAWYDLTGAIKQELRIPSGIMKEVMEKSVRDCLELTVQPRRAIGKNLFGNDHELDAATITKRASSITVNRYLVWSLIRYMEKKEKDKIDRKQADRILEKIDDKLVENYHPLNWLALVKPLFELCGPTVPTDLLRLFFEDKKQNPAAKEFDLMAAEINETQFIEVLSSPDLLYVEGYKDDQQTLFKESLEEDLEDSLNQKYMSSTEDLPEILPVDDETDIRDTTITEADDQTAGEAESTAPWDEDPRGIGTASPEDEVPRVVGKASPEEDLDEGDETSLAESEPEDEPEPDEEINVGEEVDDFIEQNEELLESSEPDQNKSEPEPETETEPEPEEEIQVGEEVDDFIDQNEELLKSPGPDQDDVTEEQEDLKTEEISDREEAVDTDVETEPMEADPPQKEVTIKLIEIDDEDDDLDPESSDDESLASRFMFDEATESESEVDQDLDEATTIYDELNLSRKGAELSTLDLFSMPEQVTFDDEVWESFEPDEPEPDEPEPDEPEPVEPRPVEPEPVEPRPVESADSEKQTEAESPLFVDESEFKSVDEEDMDREDGELPMWRSFLEREDVENSSSFEFDDSRYDLTAYDEDEDEAEVSRGVGTASPEGEDEKDGVNAKAEDEEYMDDVDESALDEASVGEDSELLDEDGFIEEPIYDLTKEETPIDQKIGDLNEWMLDEKEKFIEEIFGDSEDAYEQALSDIIEYSDWKSASRYIEKEIFTRNRIDVYDEIAVDFTDRLHSYFIEKK